VYEKILLKQDSYKAHSTQRKTAHLTCRYHTQMIMLNQ